MNEQQQHRQILIVLFMGVFMAALDSAVVAPAIPALRAAFGVGNSQISLVTIVFVLFTLSSTPLMASLSDRYSRRPVYLINVLIFAFGSFLIGVAPQFELVLVGRALQGIGGGGITPVASAVVGDVFAVEERGKVLGLIGATFGIAFLLGPLVASLIMMVASWHWIFFINLPLAAVILVMGFRVLPKHTPKVEHPPFDTLGMVLIFLLLSSLTLGINRVVDVMTGRQVWWWLVGFAVLALPLLLLQERRAADPIIPLSLFRNQQLRVTYLLALGAGFGMSSVIFISSVAVEAFQMKAQQAGLLLIPLVLGSTVASMVSGQYLNQFGSRVMMLIGFGALVLGCGLLGVFASSMVFFIIATVLIGLGVGIVVGGTLRYIVLNEVKPAERAAAQGIINIGSGVGTLLVVAILGAVADSQGGGLAGLALAYQVAAFIMLTMFLLSFALKGPQQERVGLGVSMEVREARAD